MPLVEGWEETNNCTFVRFHWVPTESEQKHVDARGGHIFHRHSLINAKMYLATCAGAGIPGWENLGSKLSQGKRIQPTGLAEDPRLPPRDPAAPRGDILSLLRGAAARYREGVSAEHQRLLNEHAALKSGTWAQRASAPKVAPTLTEARESYEQRQRWRQGGAFERALDPSWDWKATRPGTWHEWEIVEISREQARIRAIDEAEARADAYMKSRYPCWGGGT
jgi:hypothetical protein